MRVVINIPDKEYIFFKDLLKKLNYTELEESYELSEEQKLELDRRLQSKDFKDATLIAQEAKAKYGI